MRSFYKVAILRRRIKEGDGSGFVAGVFKIIRSRLFAERRLVFGMSSRKSDRRCQSARVDGYEIKEVSSWDILDQATKEQLNSDRQYLWWNTQEMLEQGCHLWLGYLDGQLAHIAWTRTGDKVSSYFFPLTERCVVISHCVTLPAYRGRGLYPATLTQITRELSLQETERFYVDCADWNTASVRGIHRAGFLLIGRGIAKKSGRLAWYQKAPPDVQLAESGDG